MITNANPDYFAADRDYDGHPTLVEHEIVSLGDRTSRFAIEEIRLWSDRLDLMTIPDLIAKWRDDDARAAGKKRAGRRPILTDRAVLIGSLLLRSENDPLHLRQLGNLFAFRLDDESRRFLGIDHVSPRGDRADELEEWTNRVTRAMARMLKPIDPKPAPRQLMNKDERRYALAQRDNAEIDIKQERLDHFVNALLEMTFQMQPKHIRDAWKGDVSVDQTMVRAVSPRGLSRKSEAVDDRDALIMEVDADYYAHTIASKTSDGDVNLLNWAYAASIAVQVPESYETIAKHPLLAISLILGKPNFEMSKDTVKFLDSLRQRGHQPGRCTADKAYFANKEPEDLAMPVRALGYLPVTDYVKGTLGKNGNLGGAPQVEGQHYCPATPEALVNASINYRKLERNTPEAKAHYLKQIEQQQKYKLRRKEKPDATGAVPMTCPAYASGATAICDHRAEHPKQSKEGKAVVQNTPPADQLPAICTQSSVKLEPTPKAMRYLQHLPYQSKEWKRTYGTDRNTIESLNAVAKDPSRGRLDAAEDRRVRGYTFAAFATALVLVTVNTRKIAAYLAEERRENPRSKAKPRVRNRNTISAYTPRLTRVNADGTVTVAAPNWKNNPAKRAAARGSNGPGNRGK